MAENNNLEEIHNALLSLQDVLKERFILLEEIKDLPKNLKIKQNTLNTANTKYLNLTEEYNKAQEAYLDNSSKYDVAVKERTDSEKKMDEISTQREYEALSKQIDEAKIKEQSLLKARNVNMNTANELKKQLDEQKTICDTLASQVAEESAKIDSTSAEKQAKIEALDQQCQELRKGLISDELYAKFSMIVQNKKGIGLVPIHGLVCQGCNMILPVQFVNDVRSNNAIEYCPYCSRILFYEESEDTLDYDTIQSTITDDEDSAAEDLVGSEDFDDIL